MKKDTVYLTMLLDYYGDLLTDKQREYFDLHYNQDYTLAEIGEMNGISRQGVPLCVHLLDCCNNSFRYDYCVVF